ncbi:MAG: hypothetical protein J7M32_06445 [Deltaproteobacteria bacterium]|nr:hypothetical protein [Deltaproteobacteria bacterium]
MPDQFRVNEAWIGVRINEEFLFVADMPYDVYVLMDAASAYVLGYVLSKVVDEGPQEKDIEDLFQKAWSAKRQWADRLIVPEGSVAERAFRGKAEEKGLSVETVPLCDLEVIVGPLKESFDADFMGRNA